MLVGNWCVFGASGSNLTSNLRDFVSRGKPSKSKKESDQDLLGFDGRAAAAGGMDAMETIGEEDGDAHLAGRAEAYREADEAGYDSPRDMRDLDDAEGMWDNADYDVAGTLNLHDDDDYGHAHPVSAVVVPPSPSMPGRYVVGVVCMLASPEGEGEGGGRLTQ